MTANLDAIIAGVNFGANGLASFAPVGTVMPTSATASLNVAFRDAGVISEDGLKKTAAVEATDVRGFGFTGPVRTLKTTRKTTFELTMMETNTTSLEVYNELALGSITVGVGGEIDFTEGEARTQKYAMVVDMIDGVNHMRGVARTVEVTNAKEMEIKAGVPVTWGVTMTAYPGSDGVAIHWYLVIPALV